MDIKILFYTCITNYYMGRQSEEQQKWGQCLAYYTLSLEKLQECEKLAKVSTLSLEKLQECEKLSKVSTLSLEKLQECEKLAKVNTELKNLVMFIGQ